VKTIKFEYFKLPVTTTNVDIYYKLSGAVELDWTNGRITHILTIMGVDSDGNKSMQSFARGMAAQVLAYQDIKSGNELLTFKDTPVEVIGYDIKGSGEPWPSMGDAAVMTKKTDTLIIDYLHIPKKDTQYHFLMRYRQPLATTFQKQTIETMFRQAEVVVAEENRDATVREFNEHQGLEEYLKQAGLALWLTDITKTVASSNFPENLHWWFKLKHVELNKHELVMKEDKQDEKLA